MSNFIQMCLSGYSMLDEVDDYVESWHDGNSKLPLHIFLGMSKSEYSLWVADPDVLPFIIEAHRNGRDVAELLEEFNAMPMAARASSPAKATQLARWLKQQGYWS